MTKEPYLAHSELTHEIYIVSGRNKYLVTDQAVKAVKAIQTLKQKPCDDAISRDAALEKMADYVASGYADSAEDFEEYSRIICQLPSVTQKSGKWILTDDDFVYCSECEDSYYPRPIDASWYYCPHCGAYMVEPQERSDKEWHTKK